MPKTMTFKKFLSWYCLTIAVFTGSILVVMAFFPFTTGETMFISILVGPPINLMKHISERPWISVGIIAIMFYWVILTIPLLLAAQYRLSNKRKAFVLCVFIQFLFIVVHVVNAISFYQRLISLPD
jgi:hypothetical protein